MENLQLTKEEQILFQNIYKNHKQGILTYIKFRLKGKSNCLNYDSEELANDVFMRVAKHIRNYDEEKASMKTWLYTITNNIIIDWNRTKMLKQQHSFDNLQYEDETVIEIPDNQTNNDFDSYDNQIIMKDINCSINNLKGISKAIANLYFINELRYDEISKELHIPLGTVKGSINRIKTKLQKDLAHIY